MTNRPPVTYTRQSVTTTNTNWATIDAPASDPDGDEIDYSASAARHGIVLQEPNDSYRFRYIPPAGFVGEDQFLITAQDGKGGVATRLVSVRVNAGVGEGVAIIWPQGGASGPAPAADPVKRVTVEFESGRREVVP